MIQSVDDKDPDSVEVFEWDYTTLLRDGDTIASIVGTAIDEAVDSKEASVLVLVGLPEQVTETPAKIVQTARAGTPSARYTLRCRVTTVLGETLDLSMYVYIANQ